MSIILENLKKVLLLILLSLVVYCLVRLQYLLWNGAQFQNQAILDLFRAFFWGLRFDLAAILILGLPTFLMAYFFATPFLQKIFAKIAAFSWAVLQLPFLVLTMGDVEFVNFVGRRMTWDSLFVLSEISGKWMAFASTYWVLFLLNLFLILTFLYGTFKICFSNSSPFHRNWSVAFKSFFVVLFFILYALGMRGGLQKKPISFAHAQIFSEPKLNQIVLNSSFTVLKSFGKESASREKFFDSNSEMQSFLNGSEKNPSLLEFSKIQKNQNVVLIIMESFATEFMPYAPFLSSLAERALYFSNNVANGKRSIEGVCAIMTSIPALMTEPFISSPFQSNYYVGIGTKLREQGYATSFFHGGHNGTMFFDQFMKSVGIEKYFGANEYPEKSDDDGTWGIYDEPFLQFMLNQLNQEKSPFFASYFSLSSHHPYKIPEEHKGKFPKGSLEIHESIGYADFALKRFFAEAEKQSWFKETLFIITADHTQKSDAPGFANDFGSWRVPLIFYHPQVQWPSIDTSEVTQQIDIMPSILDFLKIRTNEANLLSRSVFVPGQRSATVFMDGTYWSFSKDFWLTYSIDKNFQTFSLQDLKKQSPLSEEKNEVQLLQQRTKAAIQYFNEGLWDNRLYYPLKAGN